MLTEMKKYKAKLHPVVRGKKTAQILSEEMEPVEEDE